MKKFILVGQTSKGYLVEMDRKGKKGLVHLRVAREKYKWDKPPKGFQIHHIDRDKTNNKKGNLIAIHQKDHYRMHMRGDIRIDRGRKNLK